MASRGRECRGRQLGSSRPPPSFDQQAFVEAMGAEIAAIAQASVAGGQVGLSNLERFMALILRHSPGKGIQW